MAGTTPRTNKKTSKPRGENGKPKSLTEGLNERVNAAEEKVQEIEEKNKPKRGKVAELTKQLEEAAKRAEEAEKRAKEADKKTEEANKKIKELETLRDEYSKSFYKRNQELAAAEKRNIQLEVDRNVTADNLRTSQNRIKELEDSNNVYINGAKSLVNRQKALREDNERLSKVNQDYRTQNSILTESIRQSALKSDKEVTDAVNAIEPKAEEVKTDNSDGDLSSSRDVDAELREIFKAIGEGRIDDAQKLADAAGIKIYDSAKTEETVAPETGETKVEGEPEVKTEQAQATQEPKSEVKQTSTESSEMTPEEAYEYLSDKKNFKEASTYFSSGKDSYIGTNGKHLPKSWFDVYNGNKASDHSMFRSPNNKDVFTASLKEKGLLEDPKKEPSREDTVSTLAEADAKAKFDKEIESRGNKLKGLFGKHPVIGTTLIGAVGVPMALKIIDWLRDSGREQAIEDMQVPDEEFWGNSEDNEDFNGTDSDKVTEDLSNAAQETEQTGNNAEEQAAQALQENLPQGVAGLINQDKGESPVANNASTPASTKASTAESAPTQGLPPVVVNNTPPANPGSSGMTYSQKVEAAGQAPQAGSMAYNANNPDMVTSQLIDAMGQNPQTGSISYDDLYDQNFIDYWAKRNPNLAFGVSQGRR